MDRSEDGISVYDEVLARSARRQNAIARAWSRGRLSQGVQARGCWAAPKMRFHSMTSDRPFRRVGEKRWAREHVMRADGTKIGLVESQN